MTIKNITFAGVINRRQLTMKSLLKLVGGLLVGAMAGAIILIPLAVWFNDMSLAEAVKSVFTDDLPIIATIIVSLLIAFILQIVLYMVTSTYMLHIASRSAGADKRRYVAVGLTCLVMELFLIASSRDVLP